MSKRMKKLYALVLASSLCIQPIYAQTITNGETESIEAVKLVQAEQAVAQTLEFDVTKDAFVRDGSNQNTNYGTAEKLELKQATSGTGYNRKSYIGFDLGGYTAPYIKTAKVRIYVEDVIGNTIAEVNKRPIDIISLVEAESSWSEESVTWATAPKSGDKITEFEVNRREPGKYIEIEITDFINGQLAKGLTLDELSFELKIDPKDAHDNGGVIFAPKELGGKAAKLIIEEGLPKPKLEVTGLVDGMKTPDATVNAQVWVSTPNPSVGLDVQVTVNEQTVEGKKGEYDIPLEIGENAIVISVTDAENNKVEQAYKIIRVEVQQRTYYVDSINGDDANDGLTPDTAWKSLDKLNGQYFMPGNKVLFKRGGVWNGQFKPQGSGIKNYPIIVDSYGEGSKPIINGNGISSKDTNSRFPEGAVQLEGVSYYEISNLEVTNNGPEGDNNTYRGGIVSLGLGAGDLEHIYIKDCYVHDVNSSCESSRSNKVSGGILIIGDTRDKQGNNTNIKTTYDDVIVENCHVKDVAIEGIRTKTWSNGQDAPDRRNSNIIFRNNLIEEVHGDGIVISEIAKNGLVEKNIVRKHSKCDTNLNYAGCWVWDSNDTTFQYNEVYDGVDGFMDGEAYDIDMHCSNVTYQYNYSHDNIGGFCLFMNGLRQNNVFRYNVSKDDGQGTEIFHYLANTASEAPAIYNNTIYIGEGTDVNYLFHQTVGGRPYPWVNFYNNIVQVDGNLKNFAGDRNGNTTEPARGTVSNNIMYPAQFANLPGAPLSHPGLITENPMLVNPSGEDSIMDTWTQSIWDQNLGKFQITQGSPAINAGLAATNNGGQDLFGNSLYTNGKADIGAHEYSAQTTNPQVTVDRSQQVTGGRTFEVAVGIDQVTESVYAQDLVVNFDENLFKFVEAVGVGDTQMIETKEEAGKVRILLATEGGLKPESESVTLRFTPARVTTNTTSAITLSEVTFGIVEEGISEVVVAEGAGQVVTVKEASTTIDKTELKTTIAKAQALSDAAVVGDKIGQYPQAAKDTLDTAIAAAHQVVQISEEQTVIDAATATLQEAMNIFKEAQIKPAKEDINVDGIVNVADLALAAFYYQVGENDADWQIAEKADINEDKVIDIIDLGLIAKHILNK